MNFSDGLQVPEGPGGAEGHHVVLYLRNCLLWNRFCDDLNLAIQNVPKQKKQKNCMPFREIVVSVHVLISQSNVLVSGY